MKRKVLIVCLRSTEIYFTLARYAVTRFILTVSNINSTRRTPQLFALHTEYMHTLSMHDIIINVCILLITSPPTLLYLCQIRFYLS